MWVDIAPYWTLLTAVPVECTRFTHHWLWWLKTQETQVSAPCLTEFLMDHNQTWHVGWYHPTTPIYCRSGRMHTSCMSEFGLYQARLSAFSPSFSWIFFQLNFNNFFLILICNGPNWRSRTTFTAPNSAAACLFFLFVRSCFHFRYNSVLRSQVTICYFFKLFTLFLPLLRTFHRYIWKCLSVKYIMYIRLNL